MSMSDLVDRPVAFNRVFVDLGVGIVGALMLSQCIYWMKRTNDPEGWFYKSQQDWEEETGLSRREQEKARKALKSIGVLEERRQGVPARLYFRVNVDELEKALLGDIRHVTMDDVLSIYQSTLTGLSKTGMMRAQKLGAETEYVEYAAVLKRDGMVCGCCQKEIHYGPGKHGQALSFDHIVPLDAGGKHMESNLQPAHVSCNSAKQGQPPVGEASDNQECLAESDQNDLPSHPSMSSPDKQECLGETSKAASTKHTITETTAETTTEKKTSEPAGRTTEPPPDLTPPTEDQVLKLGRQSQPAEESAHLQDGKRWGTLEDVWLALWIGQQVDEFLEQDAPAKRNIASWANDIRLMRHQDRRELQHIKRLFEWAHGHHFWASNILSPGKLREQWSQLAAQRKREREAPNGKGGPGGGPGGIDYNRVDW